MKVLATIAMKIYDEAAANCVDHFDSIVNV